MSANDAVGGVSSRRQIEKEGRRRSSRCLKEKRHPKRKRLENARSVFWKYTRRKEVHSLKEKGHPAEKNTSENEARANSGD